MNRNRMMLWMITAMSFFLVEDSLASGHLTIHPGRLVLDGAQRTADLAVLNNGSETATYRLTLIQQRMTDDGSFEEVTEPKEGEQFIDGWVRFSPRQFILEPGASQLVRVQLRKPVDLAEGEYRSHLLFQALPPAVPAAGSDAVANPKFSMTLTAVVSISIPVIVRQGKPTAIVSISKIDVPDGPAIVVELQRQGGRSVYGDVVAAFTPRGGTEIIVGRASGVAVYVPNSFRRLRLPVSQSLKHGRLRVSFSESPSVAEAALVQVMRDLP